MYVHSSPSRDFTLALFTVANQTPVLPDIRSARKKRGNDAHNTDQHESKNASQHSAHKAETAVLQLRAFAVYLAITLLLTSPLVLMSWLATSIEDCAIVSSYPEVPCNH